MNCHEKVALVTGAAGAGMGRSIALTLAREGAKVVVNYRTSKAMADSIVEHIAGAGGEAIAVSADVSTSSGCETLVNTAIEMYSQIDICIINPGSGWHAEPIEKLNAQAALDDAQAELAPLYHLSPLVLPGMYERQWGRLIGISMERFIGSPAYAYNVAKAARTQALLAMRCDAWKHGVTVNVIEPGPVDAIEDFAQAVELCNHGPAWTSRTNVTPQDIAESVALLCSEAGEYISGAEIPILFR